MDSIFSGTFIVSTDGLEIISNLILDGNLNGYLEKSGKIIPIILSLSQNSRTKVIRVYLQDNDGNVFYSFQCDEGQEHKIASALNKTGVKAIITNF